MAKITKLEDQDWVINPNTGHRIDMKKLLKDQAIAYAMIESNYPFFGRLLRELNIQYTFQVETEATDGTRLFINPEFASSLSMKMKAIVIMHELMHCSLDHMSRGKYHDLTKSNIAADYEVNGLLVSDGIATAKDWEKFYYDKKYENWAYEHIYAEVPSVPTPPIQRGGQQGSGQQGSGQQGGQQGKGSGSGSGQGSNGGNEQIPHTPDYVSGWNKAIEDYKAGRIKL